MHASLESDVNRWLSFDPDPGTRAELERLLVDAPAVVADLFAGRVEFGTAGLRAPMGPGPTQMNRLVVMQTTVGVMRWLRRQHQPVKVVVGYDARHHSEQFALDIAARVQQMGGVAELLPRPLPTPVLAAAVLDRHADAGVMVTASHNPAADNGYKLYLGDGLQLVSPSDSEIAAEIDAVAESWEHYSDLARPDLARPDLARPDLARPDLARPDLGAEPRRVVGELVTLGEEIVDAHLARVVPLAQRATHAEKQQVAVVYTAMHGVGGAHMERAWNEAGFAPLHPVAAQHTPDPDFPTVAFPNPEEEGALDLACAEADRIHADAVLAHDPDADRLAVAVPNRDGEWERLTGDQIGVLLADFLLEDARRHYPDAELVVASSIVSSRMIDAVAAHHGAVSVRTLTGFKWVARPIVDRPSARYVLGYEEALGYSVGGVVRDKDGIGAGLVMGEVLAETKAAQEQIWDRLDRLYRQYGLYATQQVTVRLGEGDASAQRDETMKRVRNAPPMRLLGSEVVEVIDLLDGRALPPTDGVIWKSAGDTRVVVRPSGTEPKIKAYLEVVTPHPEFPADYGSSTRRLEELASEVAVLLGAS